jgi:hypothetical protein
MDSSNTLSCDIRVHRAGSQLKTKKCLNVRQKLGTWKCFNVFLRFPMFSNVFQCYLLSFSLFLTLFQSLIESLLTFVFISMLKNHALTHTHTLSHSHTLSISHPLTLDMLNKFCFHLYAQNSLFVGENCNAFF